MKIMVCLMFVVAGIAIGQQLPDPNFDPTVVQPAYTATHPRVAIDEAHNNFHTKDGLFKPFAELLQSDGYNVVANTTKFTKSSLEAVDILVISNALGDLQNHNTHSTPAFTTQECDALYEWIRQGGSLFLIADHAPMGDAAALLAERLGVGLGKGFVFDSNPGAFDGEDITALVFSERNHLLGKHPITHGRNEGERLHRLVAFTGESVTVPKSGTAILRLSKTAGETPTRSDLEPLHDAAAKLERKSARKWPAAGRAMAIAFTLGRGRVVVSGEAGMLTAQVFKERNKDGVDKFVGKMSMNVEGNDDRQYVLNILHWLSDILK